MMTDMILPEARKFRKRSTFPAEAISWPFPPDDWLMGVAGIHVWAIPLDIDASLLGERQATLAPIELERAARFHFQRDRNRFVAGRGALRQVLSRYLQAEPGKLHFNYGPHGKPSLAHSDMQNNLQFNLAHSEGLALLAVAHSGKIGIDLECLRPLDDAEGLVTRFFCPREIAAFQSLAETQKPAAFFNLWTRKEAWLKAIGEGIGHSLNLVEVSFLPGQSAHLLSIPEGPEAAAQWNLRDLAPAPGFAAALAIQGPDLPLHCWRWSETREQS
ncbi:MAG: 4-phosphopantetheinyl transferase [Verrucomicrobiota bacterium]